MILFKTVTCLSAILGLLYLDAIRAPKLLVIGWPVAMVALTSWVVGFEPKHLIGVPLMAMGALWYTEGD